MKSPSTVEYCDTLQSKEKSQQGTQSIPKRRRPYYAYSTKSPILTIDEDQATCLILVCRPGEEARWTGELARAVLRPETIQGY